MQGPRPARRPAPRAVDHGRAVERRHRTDPVRKPGDGIATSPHAWVRDTARRRTQPLVDRPRRVRARRGGDVPVPRDQRTDRLESKCRYLRRRSTVPTSASGLVSSDRAWRVTGGRFDPRVLGDLDRLGYRGATLDEPGAEGRTVNRVGRIVQPVGRHGMTTARPIDLGGIGKGLALRWATARLEQAGARDFLLEAGGDLVARGKDPEASRGRSASRIRPELRTWPSSRSRISRSPPRPSGSTAGGGTDGSSTTCSTHGPANRQTMAFSPSPSRRPIQPGPRSGPRPSILPAVRPSRTRLDRAASRPGGSATMGRSR